MSKQANYFKIGLFIIAGVGLILAGVVALGTASLFEDTTTVETYFQESVQGLSEGSPVKFRGVQIGQVERIMFTYNKYHPDVPLPERKPYVLVEFSVSPRGLGGVQGEPAARVLQQMVERGLRVSLGYQGLTGLAYLELDIVSDPSQYPRLDIDWERPEYYIPSYPSTIAQVSESLQSIMQMIRDIKNVPFAEIGDGIDKLLKRISALESDADLAGTTRKATKLLEDTTEVVDRIRKMLDAEGVSDMPADAAAAVARARSLLERANKDLPELLDNLKKASEQLQEVAGRADKILKDRRIAAGIEDAAGAAGDLRDATEDLPETMGELRKALRSAARMIVRQESDVQALMRELQTISKRLNRLSEDLTRHPSRLLFSDPPPRWEEVEE
jgi:paraquat-inducible protein B